MASAFESTAVRTQFADTGSADRESQRAARFGRVVFTIAGIWGILLMTPLYFLREAIERANPPAITHADLYYGFIGVTLAWQIAFLIVAANPLRHRPLMIAASLEKALYVGSIIVLAARGSFPTAQAVLVAVPDGTLGVLFLIAYARTQSRIDNAPAWRRTA